MLPFQHLLPVLASLILCFPAYLCNIGVSMFCQVGAQCVVGISVNIVAIVFDDSDVLIITTVIVLFYFFIYYFLIAFLRLGIPG